MNIHSIKTRKAIEALDIIGNIGHKKYFIIRAIEAMGDIEGTSKLQGPCPL